jgi:putative transposase
MASPLSYKESYKKNLPHIQPPGATFFITYRLADSLPSSLINQLIKEFSEEEQSLEEIADPIERAKLANRSSLMLFARWDSELDRSKFGPHWLSDPEVAGCVKDSLHYHDHSLYDLDVYCIMSNHVHIIITPLPDGDESCFAISRIMHSLNSYTASKLNKLLCRSGQFWQHESYDHIIRDEEEIAFLRGYVLDNPVKAGLVASADEWPWSYSKYGGV